MSFDAGNLDIIENCVIKILNDFLYDWYIIDNEPVIINGESSDSSNENVGKVIITNNEIVNKFCGLENIEHSCSIISLIHVFISYSSF